MNLSINQVKPYCYVSKIKNEPLHNPSPVIQTQTTQHKQMRLSGFKTYSASLVSFGYYFKLKAEKDLPCPCCGVTMTTIDEIDDFIDKMDGATGNTIIENIEKYEDRLPYVERSVTNRLKVAAEKHENLDLNGLLKEIQHEPKKELERTQKEILNEIKKLAEVLTDDTYNVIQKDLEAIDKIIITGKNGNPFKRKTLIQGMEKVRDNEINPHNKIILDKIVEKTTDMPTSSTDANAFIVKYCRRTTPEIARRLIEPSQATAEHIKPHSKDGHDGPENYLSECKKCNNDRGNMTYVEWLKIHPEMVQNTQTYMDEVINKIIDGTIQGFEFYPAAVKKAVFEESGGRIDLDISKFNDFKTKKEKTPASDAKGSNLHTVG